MARELTSKTPAGRDKRSDDQDAESASANSGGALQDAIDAFGSLYASIAGFALSGLESLADRRAEARAAELRQREAPARVRARRGLAG
jgi:hypothetical protein